MICIRFIVLPAVVQNFAQFAREGAGLEWFLQTSQAFMQHSLMHNGILGGKRRLSA